LRCTLVKCGCRLVHDDHRESDQYQEGHFGKEFSIVDKVLSMQFCSLASVMKFSVYVELLIGDGG
jgi:hypothetical protein